jgi:hypothetical protein
LGPYREEVVMKRLLAAVALAVFGLTPAIAAACEDYDATSASATPAALMASSPVPAASKAPAPAVAKSLAPAKQATGKAKAPVAEQKVVLGTTN